MIKLKRCPFCGTKLTNEKPSRIYVHERTGCILDLRGITEEDCEKWNTRKPMDKIVELLEEELDLAYNEKERCARVNPLQFDSAKGYSTGIYNAIKIVKEENEDTKEICLSTGLACIRCNPGACDHRKEN